MTKTSAKDPQGLPEVDPFDGKASPEWVKERHPEYAVAGHATGPVTSVRTLYARGHSLDVLTTYDVRMDGKPVHLHLMVDNDGRLWSHVCPYRTFASAPELLRHILEEVPEALQGLTPEGCEHTSSHHDHEGHH